MSTKKKVNPRDAIMNVTEPQPILSSFAQRRISLPPSLCYLEELVTHIFIQESGNGGISHQPVRPFHQSMPLVPEAHVFYRDVALTQGCYNLLSLANGYARVVRAVNDEKRRGDVVDVVDGRNALQKLVVVFQAAVFGLTELAAPWAGILQKRDEVGDADDIDGGCPQGRVGRDGR